MEVEHLKTLVLPQLPEPAGGYVSMDSTAMSSPVAAAPSPVDNTTAPQHQTQPVSPTSPETEISPTYNRREDRFMRWQLSMLIVSWLCRPLNIGRGGAQLFTEHPPAEGETNEPHITLEPLSEAQTTVGTPVLIKVTEHQPVVG